MREQFHIGWKQKLLWNFCVVAFSDGKPDSTDLCTVDKPQPIMVSCAVGRQRRWELERNRFRLNRDFALSIVRSHDLVRKVCNFSGSCSSGRGQPWWALFAEA
jgi:hypothetical protein